VLSTITVSWQAKPACHCFCHCFLVTASASAAVSNVWRKEIATPHFGRFAMTDLPDESKFLLTLR